MRTLFVRSFQSVIAFAAVALLTGANDAGCGLGTVINGSSSGGGGSVSTGPLPVDPPAPIACPAGMVALLVCNDTTSGGGGNVFEVEPCDGPNCPPPPPPPCDPGDANCIPPTPGDAGAPPPCDPGDANCGSPPMCDPADPSCGSPPPPPPQCDPSDPSCPPSFPPPGCWIECVPADQTCPPGTDAVTICTDSGSGGGDNGTGGAGPGGDPDAPVSSVTCWTECAPHGCGGETPSEPAIPD